MFSQLGSDWIRATNSFHQACQERLTRADAELLKFQTERAQLVTELAEGQARFRSAPRGSRSEAPVSPSRTEGWWVQNWRGCKE